MARVMFGLGPSPLILNGTLNAHLDKYSKDYPICVRELEEGTYVDDIKIAEETIQETKQIKEHAIGIFSVALNYINGI